MKLRPGTPEEAGMSAQQVQRVANLAEGWVEQGIHPALVVLVARKGQVVLHEAFGCLRPESNSPPLERDTIFPVASITKPITATMVMLLVEDGLLGLNRPVAEYLPEFIGEGKDKVMVHHLLTHTSGLNNEEVQAHIKAKGDDVEIPPADETQHPWIHRRLFLSYDAPLWKPPGKEMSYCNSGYELLGEIVRRVSRRSVADFARERIFEPLGMVDAGYVAAESVRHRIVRRPEDTPFSHWNNRGPQERPSAAGGVSSTAMDMAIFGQMFLNRGIYGNARILSPASVAEMTRNQIPGISSWLPFMNKFFPEAGWGFGWNILGDKKDYGTLHSPQAFDHGGSGGVYLCVDPVYELVGVYFSVAPRDDYDSWCLDLFMNAVTAAVVDV